MNEGYAVLKNRRSIRNYKPDMPEREILDAIVEAGLSAPSANNLQETKILVVTNKELKEKLIRDNKEIWKKETDDPFYKAPVIMIVIAKASNKNAVADGSLVMGNILNAAEALGLGGIWINRAREEFERDDYKQLLKDLGIEGEWIGIGHAAIGYKNCANPQPHPIAKNRVYYLD